MIKRLGNTNQKIYEFLSRYIASNQVSPTIAEIQRHFEMSAGGVHGALMKLERDGLIKRTPNIARGIAIAPVGTPTVGWTARIIPPRIAQS